MKGKPTFQQLKAEGYLTPARQGRPRETLDEAERIRKKREQQRACNARYQERLKTAMQRWTEDCVQNSRHD